MTESELQKAREAIGKRLFDSFGWIYHAQHGRDWEKLPEHIQREYLNEAKELIKLPFIAILSSDQALPENPYLLMPALPGGWIAGYERAQKDMLKDRWQKTVAKEG